MLELWLVGGVAMEIRSSQDLLFTVVYSYKEVKRRVCVCGGGGGGGGVYTGTPESLCD